MRQDHLLNQVGSQLCRVCVGIAACTKDLFGHSPLLSFLDFSFGPFTRANRRRRLLRKQTAVALNLFRSLSNAPVPVPFGRKISRLPNATGRSVCRKSPKLLSGTRKMWKCSPKKFRKRIGGFCSFSFCAPPLRLPLLT